MYYAKAIDHVTSNRHFYFTISFAGINYLYSQPLTKKVFLHHMVYDQYRCTVFLHYNNLFSCEVWFSLFQKSSNSFTEIFCERSFLLKLVFSLLLLCERLFE